MIDPPPSIAVVGLPRSSSSSLHSATAATPSGPPGYPAHQFIFDSLEQLPCHQSNRSFAEGNHAVENVARVGEQPSKVSLATTAASLPMSNSGDVKLALPYSLPSSSTSLLAHQHLEFRPCDLHSSSSPPSRSKTRKSNIVHTITFFKKISQFFRNEYADFKLALKDLKRFLKDKKRIKKLTKGLATSSKFWIWFGVILGLLVLSAILSSYHHKITSAIAPFKDRIRNIKGSWVVPTVLLIIVSFPPLLGHELIILVSGMIWGIWVGFGIACLGTFLGELATYYAFKRLVRSKSEAIEENSITYSSLVKLMRDGGLTMVILVRCSALPGHITTAIQASIGISIWIFSLACLITLPKQFAIVYLGVVLAESPPSSQSSLANLSDPAGFLSDSDIDLDPVSTQSIDDHAHHQSTHHLISIIIFLITILFTIISAYLVWIRMRRVRPAIKKEFEEKKKKQVLVSDQELIVMRPSPTSSHCVSHR